MAISGEGPTRSTPRKRYLRQIAPLLLALCMCLGKAAHAQTHDDLAQNDPGDDAYLKKLAGLEIEDLLTQEITSVSKKTERLWDTSAAVTVLTQEDIRRSGASNIPEALRLVPGLIVARIDAHQWAITARGFNGFFANKLLVLIDGRSVYTPLFSGVYWDVQDTMIEDIDRIEVIKGPGASVWGANAVNGVINIITKNAAATKGGIVSYTGGTEQHAAGARYGMDVGESSHFRSYGKYNYVDDSEFADGFDFDHWNKGQGGFRLDSELGPKEDVTFQGDGYGGTELDRSNLVIEHPPFVNPVSSKTNFAGANVLGRWNKGFADSSSLTIQSYFDAAQRNDQNLDQSIDTWDFDTQYRLSPIAGHQIQLGLGYRLINDDFGPVFARIDPSSRSYEIISGFVQDEIALVRDRLSLVLGSKLDHNDFSGLEAQPTARLLWHVDDDNTLWSAFSRSLRTASRADEGAVIDLAAFPGPNGLPTVLTAFGDRNNQAEQQLSYELGYRVKASSSLTFDTGAYYDHYDDLLTFETGMPLPIPRPNPHTLIPIFFSDQGHGDVYGTSVVSTYTPFKEWQLQGWYSHLTMELKRDPGSNSTNLKNVEGSAPEHQAGLRSLVTLPHGIEFDSFLRYVDNLSSQQIPAYVDLNMRLGYHLTRALELAVIGENLLHNEHPEFVSDLIGARRSSTERSVSGRIVYNF